MLEQLDLELAGKTAIVTGGSRGIGKAIARELLKEGVRLVIVARDSAQLRSAATDLRSGGGEVHPIRCDTGSNASVRAMVATAASRLGGIDILVNCAGQPGGQSPPVKLSELTDKALWQDVNVKVMGYLRCIREVVPHMIKRGGGRIVNISGTAARSTGSVVGSIRNVSVAAMTKNLADELAPHSISVVVVHPATTRTEKTPQVARARAKLLHIPSAEAERRLADGILLGRLVDAKEVAYVVAFLCSSKAVAINGDAVVASGGVRGSIYY